MVETVLGAAALGAGIGRTGFGFGSDVVKELIRGIIGNFLNIFSSLCG